MSSMEKLIRKYVEYLVPTEEEIKNGKRQMDKVFEYLRKSRLYSIDRARLVGSVGKKTSVRNLLDFDCVLFVNPFSKKGKKVKIHNVVENFKDILLEETDLKKADFKKNPKKNAVVLMFSFENVGFDISVAINEVSSLGSGDRVSQKQGTSFLRNPDNKSVSEIGRSVSLSEMNIEHAATKSSFAHQIARLAKFWNKTIQLQLEVSDSYVGGRSSVIELVAFAAAEEEENTGSNSHLNAFKIFLQKIKSIKSLALSHDEFWKQQEIPFSLPPNLPYLLNPSDPSNDMLKDISEEILDLFSKHATETMKRLESNNLKQLFEMQPLWHQSKINNWQPSSLRLDFNQSDPINFMFDDGGKHRDQKGAKMLRDYIKILVLRHSVENIDDEKAAQKGIEDSIMKDIFGSESSLGLYSYGRERGKFTVPTTGARLVAVHFD